VAVAALTWEGVAPAWARALSRAGAEAAVVLLPSIPTDTMGAWTVRGAPPVPRMAARGGHDTSVETESPGPSEAMIERGD
jgi:hypothetical protein